MTPKGAPTSCRARRASRAPQEPTTSTALKARARTPAPPGRMPVLLVLIASLSPAQDLRFAKVELLRKPRHLSHSGRSDTSHEIRDTDVETKQFASNCWWNQDLPEQSWQQILKSDAEEVRNARGITDNNHRRASSAAA